MTDIKHINPHIRLTCFLQVILSYALFISCSPKVADVQLPYEGAVPESFSQSGTVEMPDKWWLAFDDPKLNVFMDSAMESNLSLKAVWYQLQEAKAQVSVSKSGLSPNVDLQLQSGISRPEPDFVGGENTQLTLGASYEIDLWGRIRYTAHADQYRMEASYQDYKTAAISLSSEIALSWFRLKALKYQVEIVENQIENNEKVLELIKARFINGLVRAVDVLRQKQLIEGAKAQKSNLQSQLGVLKNQLAVLLGRPPGAGFDDVEAALPDLPPLPETGVPLTLVARRPDVKSAFYNLQATDRELAAAISNKYPRLTLSLRGAIRSNTFTDLFQSQAASLTGSLLGPLFYGGRLNAEVDRSEAVKQQSINNYGQTVLSALREVENALVREFHQQERIEHMADQLKLAEQAYEQLRIQYLNGSAEYLEVLVALNQEQQLQRDLINEKANIIEIRIALYRALAGGFDVEEENTSDDTL